MGKFDGKVVVVTGGAGGIGSVTSRLFVEGGARVVVADLDLERAEAVASELGDAAFATHLDAEVPESVEALIDGTVEQHGRIDVLHNNAALTNAEIFGRDKTVADTDIDVWDACYRINLRGYVLGAKYAIPHMVEQGGGVIINMATDAGLLSDTKHVAYGTTKAAVVMLTQSIATQFGKKGVRSVTISPGAIMTQTLRNNQGQAAIDMLMRHHLTPYIGEPEDIGNLVFFLASNDAKYITGINISCDGGLISHLPHFGDVVATVS
jgi:NAD(P)-dependent dehydrogenase (short-subunit alcohol dehydrogenase family)